MTSGRCPYPRGKGVGGTMIMNDLMYVRGNIIDYDRWAALDNPGWTYNQNLPYFKKVENATKIKSSIKESRHGFKGPINLEHSKISKLLETFIEAGKEMNLTTRDYNGNKQIGASQIQFTLSNGKREYSAKSYLEPILKKKNLKIMTDSYVMRLLMIFNVVIGVEFAFKGQIYWARAMKEVILSAGVFGSPQILMLSGIGPRRHLTSLGIPVVQNLAVGQNLQDHPAFFGLLFNTNITEQTKTVKEYVSEFLNGTNESNLQGIMFNSTEYMPFSSYSDVEYILMSPNNMTPNVIEIRALGYSKENAEAIFKKVKKDSLWFTLIVTQLHPLSSGTVRLKSKNPFDYPLINPKFLMDSQDQETMYNYVQLGLKFINSTAFKKINATLVKVELPACKSFKYLSEDYWKCYIRQATSSLNHPVGTCSMGKEEIQGAVVDRDCRVFGVRNLRVVDASVFPFSFSGHPIASCLMLGEKVSDIIKNSHTSWF